MWRRSVDWTQIYKELFELTRSSDLGVTGEKTFSLNLIDRVTKKTIRSGTTGLHKKNIVYSR
jgi:hypothetical protein